MEKREYVSDSDTRAAAGPSGAGCCEDKNEEAVLRLFSQLTFEEKYQLVQILERLTGQKGNT